jgi:hypothetical protein
MAPYSLICGYQRFEEIYCLHLQERNNSETVDRGFLRKVGNNLLDCMITSQPRKPLSYYGMFYLCIQVYRTPSLIRISEAKDSPKRKKKLKTQINGKFNDIGNAD